MASTLFACGGSQGPRPDRPMEVRTTRIGGAEVAWLEADLGDSIVVSVFIDAGARDAGHPWIPVVTAWALGET
ncbi:MAG: hypothetical protein AAGF12_43290, partial [Myxococcota bacterium]